MPSRRTSFHSGAMLIILTIITGVIVLLMAISLALFSLSINQRRISQNGRNEAFVTLDGCAEEALQHLRHDFSYAGETMVINNITCTVTITGTDLNRTLAITTSGDFIKNLQISVILYPTFTVSSWQELSS